MPLVPLVFLFFYAIGVLILLAWLVKAKESAWLKLLVAALYFGIPTGIYVNQEARNKAHRAKAEQADLKARNDRAESEAAFVRFCEENLKTDNPLPKCKPFRSLGPDEEQLSIK